MIGLAGAHRTGKTTLAKRVSELTGIHYHDANVSGIMNRNKFNPVFPSSIEARLDAQIKLLDEYEKEIAALPTVFITDRTPIDFVGYTLAEVGMHATSPALGDKITAYTQRAMKLTSLKFGLLLLVRPIGDYEEDINKPPMNTAYQNHIQYIIEGAAQQLSDDIGLVAVGAEAIESRAQAVKSMIDAMLHGADKEMPAGQLLN